MHVLNLFYLYVLATNCFSTFPGVHTVSEKRYLRPVNISDEQLSEEITIKSPGYPWKNYERDTTYTWMVTAPELTEEINIRIELDVHYTPGYQCEDYLKIQEIRDSNFQLFKQCGKLTENRTARGNKLMITLYSNHDRLTAKGFRLHLKVSKMSTRSTIMTTLATTSLILSKTSTTTETNTTPTPKTEHLFSRRTKTRNKETILKTLSTKTASVTEDTTRKSRKTKISTMFQNWKATSPTTSKVIMSEVLSSASTLYTSLSPLLSTTEMDKILETTPVVITTDSQNTSPEKTKSSRTKLNAETSTGITQLSNGFIQSQEMDSQNTSTVSPEKPISSSTELTAETSPESIPMSKGFTRNQDMDSQNTSTVSPEKPISSSTELTAGTSTKSIPMSKGFILNQEIVILMVGVGVVEVTIIIVGILAVRRHRQQRKYTMKRTSKEAHDTRPVSRKTICSVDNVYATIPDEMFDENPYKDLSEGVYDTTSKRRSHVNCSRNNYCRGSFFSRLFHDSNFSGRRSREENISMSLKKETIVLV